MLYKMLYLLKVLQNIVKILFTGLFLFWNICIYIYIFESLLLVCTNITFFSECSYCDPEAVVGCEDGTVRVFDMYSRKCSQIIRYALQEIHFRNGVYICFFL